MAVSEVKLAASTSGNMASGSNSSVPLTGNYTSRYLVKCDDPGDTPDVVLRHFLRSRSLPWIGRPYKFGNGFDRLSVCRNIDVRMVDNSGGHFVADARFESLVQEEEEDDKEQKDPFRWHDEIEVSYTQQAVAVEKAKFLGFTGVSNPYMPIKKELPLTNSALVPLDPPLEKELDIKVIRITKVVRNYDDQIADRFNGTINSDQVVINKPAYGFRTTIPSFNGRMKVIGGSFQIENGIKFWRQTIEVHVTPNPLGWTSEVLDVGFDELYRSGDTLPGGGAVNATTTNNRGYLYNKILGRDGTPVTSPMLLNGKGKQLTPGAQPVYGRWSIYKEVSWAGIRW